jgi:hypothetical protein
MPLFIAVLAATRQHHVCGEELVAVAPSYFLLRQTYVLIVAFADV